MDSEINITWGVEIGKDLINPYHLTEKENAVGEWLEG